MAGYRWPVVVGATLALPVFYITGNARGCCHACEALGRILCGRSVRAVDVQPTPVTG
jgi:hypothetical protein